jgi:hypothetical protein
MICTILPWIFSVIPHPTNNQVTHKEYEASFSSFFVCLPVCGNLRRRAARRRAPRGGKGNSY